MYCYLEFCWVLPPLIGDLIGSLIGLALWGKQSFKLLRHAPKILVGFYVCLFAVTIWMLRRKRSKHTPAMVGIVILFVLNVVQTSEPVSAFPHSLSLTICRL